MLRCCDACTVLACYEHHRYRLIELGCSRRRYKSCPAIWWKYPAADEKGKDLGSYWYCHLHSAPSHSIILSVKDLASMQVLSSIWNNEPIRGKPGLALIVPILTRIIARSLTLIWLIYVADIFSQGQATRVFGTTSQRLAHRLSFHEVHNNPRFLILERYLYGGHAPCEGRAGKFVTK